MLTFLSMEYFLWILCAVILFFIVYYTFRSRSDNFKFYLLVGLVVFTWINHFSRYWLDSNYSTYKIFFVDFCGFNTLMLPFLLLSKRKISYDIMYLCGALFALHSLVYPNNILGDKIFDYNTIRFFFAHFLLVGIPLWMIMWKMHVPNIKNVKWAFVYLLVGALYNFGLSYWFLQVGYTTELMNYMGLWGNTDSVYRYSEILAPFLRYDVIIDGVTENRPIPYLYMIPTLIVVYVPIWVLMTWPFSKIKKVNH